MNVLDRSERTSISWCTTGTHCVTIQHSNTFNPKDLQVHGAKNQVSCTQSLLWPVVGHDHDCMLVVLTSTCTISTYITTESDSHHHDQITQYNIVL